MQKFRAAAGKKRQKLIITFCRVTTRYTPGIDERENIEFLVAIHNTRTGIDRSLGSAKLHLYS